MLLFNEAYYFGKSKELIEIDKQMSIIREKIKSNKLYSPTNSKETKIIEKNLCKIFNFERFDLTWETSPITNAYTYGQTNMLMPLTKSDFTIEKNSKGIRFKDSKGKIALVTMYTGLVHYMDLTGPEMTSILLHEIGHNFYNTNYLRVFSPLLLIISIIHDLIYVLCKSDPVLLAQFLEIMASLMLKVTRTGRRITVSLKDFDNKFTGGLFQKITSYNRGIADYLFSLLNDLLMIPLGPILLIDSTMKMPFITISKFINTMMSDGYRNEKFSDNFATMYGYGSEVASVQAKFERKPPTTMAKVYDKIPLVNAYYNFLNDYLIAILSLSDEHPATETRIKDQKRLLEEALNESNLSEKDKKAIRMQIKEIDKTYKDFTTYADSEFKYGFRALLKAIKGEEYEDWKENIWKSKDYNWDDVINANESLEWDLDLL